MTNRIKYIDPTTADDKMRVHIARTEAQLSAVKQVIESLRALEGKNISHHIANKLAKQFPSLKFSVDREFSWFNLSIMSPGFNTVQMMLAYNTEPKVINCARIIELNQRYLLDEMRLVKYRAELEVVEEKVKEYNEALSKFLVAQARINDIHFIVSPDYNLLYAEDHNGRAV